MHLGFGLTGFGRRRALEYDGGVAREVLVVASAGTDRFCELVNVGIDRADAERLPLIGSISAHELGVNGAHRALIQFLSLALRVEHLNRVGGEIVWVGVHLLKGQRGSIGFLGHLAERGLAGDGKLQCHHLGNARGSGVARVIGVARIDVSLVGNLIGKARGDDDAVLFNFEVDVLPRSVFHAEEIPQAVFSRGGHEVDAMNIAALDRLVGGSNRGGGGFCSVTA